MLIEDREYQLTAEQRVREAIRAGYKRILLVAPTGSGKTVIASRFQRGIKAKGNSSLFIAHRRELIRQASEKLEMFGIDHGLILAGCTPSLLHNIQIASIQTFTSRIFNNNNIIKPRSHLNFIDEAHRALAASYQRLFDEYPDTVFVGLTATPCRADGRGLGGTWEIIIEVSSPKELIALGYLVPTHFIAPSIPDLEKYKANKNGEYKDDDVEEMMSPLIGDVLKNWREHAEDRQTIIFAPNVKQSLYLEHQFTFAGIKCAHVDGDTPTEKRDQIFKDLENEKIQVVTNCQVAVEGLDIPIVSCVVLANPNKSIIKFIQSTGRGGRPHKESGKIDNLVIDHAGAIYEHGYPEDITGWSLDPDLKIQDIRAEKAATERKKAKDITCRNCWHVYIMQSHCPRCGQRHVPEMEVLNVNEGRLRKLKVRPKRKPQKSEQQKFWNECIFKASHKGLKCGAAAHMYKNRFGTWPNRNFEYMPKGEQWQKLAKVFLAENRNQVA